MKLSPQKALLNRLIDSLDRISPSVYMMIFICLSSTILFIGMYFDPHNDSTAYNYKWILPFIIIYCIIKIPHSLRNMKSETDNNITVDNYIDGITTKQEKKNLITLFSILFLFFLVMSILTMMSFLMIQYMYYAITTIMIKVFSILMFTIFSFLSLYCFIMLMKIRKKKI